MIRTAFAPCFVWLLCAAPALAFERVVVADDFFKPAQPIEGLPIAWNGFLLDGCGLKFTGPSPNPEGDAEWLLVEDDQLHLFIVDSEIAGPCFLPPQIDPVFDAFNLGPLEPGDYTLNVYGVANATLFPVDVADFTPNYQVAYSVGDGIEPIPTLNPLNLAILIVLLLVIAIWRVLNLDAFHQ
ncbi:MAG: hypothetical protein AAGH65_00450 [Pseudomonadota bacterium]